VRLEQERFTVQDPGAKPLQWMVPVALADLSGQSPHAWNCWPTNRRR